MKRIEGKDIKINYFGIELYVYHEMEFIATDSDGEVRAHYDEPTTDQSIFWGSRSCSHVCNVDLEGMDWKETLMEIKR